MAVAGADVHHQRTGRITRARHRFAHSLINRLANQMFNNGSVNWISLNSHKSLLGKENGRI
jgi:hypothetical protein